MIFTLKPSGSLDFDTVPVVWKAAHQQFAAATEIELDFADVTYCNSAALALLLEWLMEAEEAGKRLRIKRLPSKMLAIATTCGIGRMFEGLT